MATDTVSSSAGGLHLQDLHIKPLFLALFLASTPLFPPNAYTFTRLLSDNGAGVLFGLAVPAAVGVFALIMFICSARDRSKNAFSKSFTLACVLGYVLTQAALTFVLIADLATTALLLALVAAWAFFSIPVIMAWLKLYAMKYHLVVLHASLTCIITCGIMWSMTSLSPQAACIIMAVLAAASCVVLVEDVTHRREGDIAEMTAPNADSFSAEPGLPGFTAQGTTLGQSLGNLLSILWLLLLGFILSLFMMSSYSFSINDVRIGSECIGGIIAAFITLIAYIAHRNTPLVITLERFVVPLCLAINLILGSFPVGSPLFFLGGASVYTSLMLVSLLTLSAGAVIASNNEFPTPLVVSAFLLAVCLTEIVGYACSVTVFADGAGAGQTSWLLICIYTAIVLIDTARVAWRSAAQKQDVSDLPVMQGAAGAEMISPDELLKTRVEALSEARGLTARESELLEFLARGYGASYLAKKFFISESTARTHIKHIYKKLEVTSREELISLFESEVSK